MEREYGEKSKSEEIVLSFEFQVSSFETAPCTA